MKNKVTIYCYYKETQMDRDKAIAFYREAAACSDGSEKERYMEILMDLYAGLDYCSDKVM